ncbi:hypothetical protein Taro_042233 [Colocasia esculenta]|uniref:Kinesin-like protein n=1 Tax=Colocasia esculenta TaxID=4460 RepID=A0A843WDF3_COLES|nr:hypothetical protein [Colocasia esculenta]
MFFTPNRKLGFSLPPSPAPFTAPRSERRPSDLRWADGASSSSRNDKDKEANVQVMVRCRPLSDEEQRLNVQHAILCNEQRREVTVLQSVIGRQLDKAFTFDKVFGPRAQQRSIYEHAISPIVHDVLEGFNCTVFAYGQTGTGKTYTMEGEIRSKSGELSADAGVTPRAVRQIFDTLEAQKADYSMKVTFLELYNEEIIDLLAPEDSSRSMEDRQRRPISLMEDGKGGAVIRGLEEEVVYSANDIYGLLERGSARRRTGDTLLNKQSSRSHSVFSITIHVKEGALGDQELIKCGRLNLVDLAGSENISRSGVRESRAREAGELNKSLLTLGRVITALVEHSGHVPYRDSKLTRLLRESLGGKAKTCIIATISPSAHCLEETLSTLDYAYRAKGIRNKPEANQKLSKSVLLKDLYLEMERMKQDVKAAREKNGVYIPHERFVQDEAEKKENLEETKRALHVVQEDYRTNYQILKEKESMISKLLHADHKTKSEAANKQLIMGFRSQLDQSLKDLHKNIVGSVSQQHQLLRRMDEHACSFIARKCEVTKSIESKVGKMKDTYSSGIAVMRELASALDEKASSNQEKLKSLLTSGTMTVENFLITSASEAEEVLHEIQRSLVEQKQLLSFSTQQQEAGLQRSLAATHVISKMTIDFFHDLENRASRLKTILEENHVQVSQQMANFQKAFQVHNNAYNEPTKELKHPVFIVVQEKSMKEESEALEKIAGILSSLTSNKTKMVGKCFNLASFLFWLLAWILKLSSSEKVAASMQRWRNAESSICALHKDYGADIDSSSEEAVLASHNLLEDFMTRVSSTDLEFDMGTSDLLRGVNGNHSLTLSLAYNRSHGCHIHNHLADSLLLDHKSKEEMEPLSALCLDQLKSLQDYQTENIADIRDHKETCLSKEYKVCF